MKHARKDYDRIQDPAGLIGEDEPVFLLRAKDPAAPAVVRFWVRHAERMGSRKTTLENALLQADRMEQWQLEHINESRGCADVPPNTCVNCGRSFQEGEELRAHAAEPCEW